jgi:hypothetical protein
MAGHPIARVGRPVGRGTCTKNVTSFGTEQRPASGANVALLSAQLPVETSGLSEEDYTGARFDKTPPPAHDARVMDRSKDDVARELVDLHFPRGWSLEGDETFERPQAA